MARAALKALSRKPATYTEIASTFKALKRQRSDRAIAILASALVEDALEDAIVARLSPLSKDDHASLFEGEGPLSTFSARIRVGFALSIFGKITRDDLNCMRDIRNAFAHARISLKFTTREVTDACKNFGRKHFPKTQARVCDTSKPQSKSLMIFWAWH
jgi:DNA-binding MltR family transcriptional regulator